MLCRNNYPREYIAVCRSNMETYLAAYEQLIHAAIARGANGETSQAIETFAPLHFNQLTVVLDGFFVHRSRILEGKDGNPMNEVRMICSSVLENGSILMKNNTIKYDPSKTVLNIPLGQAIALSLDQFKKLSRAYFDGIEANFAA